MIANHRLTIGLLGALAMAVSFIFTACGSQSGPSLELSSTRPSLIFFYTDA